MATVEQHIDVAVPLGTAYERCTHFEELPRFMDGVVAVEPADGTHLHWRVRMDGGGAGWEAEITEQRPDERVAWRSVSGIPHTGVVTLHPLGDAATRVTVMLDTTVGTARDALERRLKADLARFKALVEAGSRAPSR